MNVKKPQRKSYQREVIERELKKLSSHPTAAELYELVRDVLPKISLGTVYRNLEQLSESGAVQKLANGTSTRFDGNTEYHNHVRCVNCDMVADVWELPNEPPVQDFQELAGFRIVGCNVEFMGICPECQKKNNSIASKENQN